MEKLVENKWDYTKHAKFYSYRPNYAPKTIDMLIKLIGKKDIRVADIGAGTGNLSIMLLERGCEVISVEPNDAMREIGVDRTKGENITWVRAVANNSTLESGTFDWVTFGSSFDVIDRNESLQEAYRLLKKEGYFTCMWNHRDLNDPIQKIAEDTILEFVPNYTRGTRREDQRPVIENRKDLFDNIVYTEEDFYFHQSIENYINAWKSVKNKYWDVATKEGEELLNNIMNKIKERLPKEFSIKYTTRTWSAKKI
ncbi:class I SAM-dependent methyltransferase [Campylobacter hepaticus]|uniref:Class I SAM-dependent methyltransferase n=1 Tax=Campylobacter hepaticus TaxID=1813019 RepID=A0A6A7JSX6_9BACT|nr:class I SAM-dependent methyltransferase [Campylobacter hepaticus]AXP09027.1 class I SAM-dependent methyltransferase [Campylobacter hepaticus]MPV54533.1 methyltransferase domain-containing protein [Campylobacter hepaticus]MPV62547.1 methyltransferase domain-containing protein [Campylobacter hepaticus]MPV77577.1 methyltransferase domain-containing protein [Campylobacter hepaticus]MPV78811.1 methyltransferase domain-containing protein [Campylobacter hepaticus]